MTEKESLIERLNRFAASRRTEDERRVCSQGGCPGDGRYHPPGKAHLPGCQHDATAWAWEQVRPLFPPE